MTSFPLSAIPLVHGLAAMAAAVLLGAAVPALAQQPYTLDVPYVPTPNRVVDTMLRLGQVGPADTVIDLGSGDGRIAIAAVRDSGARSALGVDIDADRVAEARANARNAGVGNKVQFKRQDLFETDFSKATVLTMYLLPEVNLKLRPVILDRLAPGTRVVSHAFTMADWEPDAVEDVEGRRVHLWIVPAKVEGRWQATGPDGPFTLSLTQQFQKVQGTARVGGKDMPLGQPTFTGDRLAFALGGRQYVGQVRNGAIAAVKGEGDVPAWRAQR